MADVSFTVEAVDRASSVMRNVSSALTGLNQGLQLVQQVARGVGQVVNATVGEFVRYSNEVRQMTMLTGQSATEMSRLIQVADDYKITTEALTMAQRELSKDGMSLSIDTMARLSDAYLQLGDGAERTRFLLENFGRSGLQMAEMMEQGSERIRAAAAGISGGLILDEADLARARRYERTLDDMSDNWRAIRIEIGSQLLPVVNDFLEAELAGVEAWREMPSLVGQTVDLLENGGGFMAQLVAAAQQFGRYYSVSAIMTGSGAYARAMDEMIRNSFGRYTAGGAYTDWATGMAGGSGRTTLGPGGEIIGAGGAGAEEPLDLTDQYREQLSIAQSLMDIEGQRIEINAQIATALAAGYSEAGSTVSDLREQLAAVDTQQQQMMANMVYGWEEAAAAVGGFSEEEKSYLLDLQVSLGIITQEVHDQTEAFGEARDILMSFPSDIRVGLMIEYENGSLSMSALMAMYAFQQDPTAARQAVLDAAAAEGTSWTATGGSFSGWGVVGDAPGRMATPFTEAIYAPGGATVYPAGSPQTQALVKAGARGFASGGSVSPMGSGDGIDLSYKSINDLARALASELSGRM